MVWSGRDLNDYLVSAPLPWEGTLSTRPDYSEPLEYCNLALNISRSGTSIASLGNLHQYFTTLKVKNFFVKSNLNLISFILKPFPFHPIIRWCLTVFGFSSKKHNVPRNLSSIPIFLLTVCFWNMACSSGGATQEPLTEPWAAARDHLAWLNKAFQQLLWLKCQTSGSIQVPLLLKDFSVLRGQSAGTEQRAGTLGK